MGSSTNPITFLGSSGHHTYNTVGFLSLILKTKLLLIQPRDQISSFGNHNFCLTEGFVSAKHQVALILPHGPLRESSPSCIWMVCGVSPGHHHWTSFCPTSSCGQYGSDQFVQASTTFAHIQCGGSFLLPVSCFLGFLCCCDVRCRKDFWSWAKLHRLRA